MKAENLIEDVSDELVDILLDRIWADAELYGKKELKLTKRKDLIKLYILLANKTIEKLRERYKIGTHKSLLEDQYYE